jgi:hypothetical protein
MKKMMIKYNNVWLEIIAYIWRTHDLPIVRPQNDVEVEDRRPPFHINGRQSMCIDWIKAIVGHDGQEDWFDELEGGDGSNDSDSRNSERLSKTQQEELESRVLELKLSLLDKGLGCKITTARCSAAWPY